MWNFTVEVILFQIGTLLLCIFTWILYPQMIKDILINYRTVANTVLWSTLFILILIPAEHGIVTALIISTSTVILTNSFLRFKKYKINLSKNSVLRNQPKIIEI